MSRQPSGTDVEAFRSVLTHQTGLRFDDDRLPLLAELLSSRILATGARSAESYLERIAGTPHELGELARTLSVTETYFYRNRDQLRAFESALEKREAGGSRHLRLLSAACSSGEEAYSLAIAVRETLRSVDTWTISILGVDLNPDVLAKARAGSYTRWSLRETPDGIRGKYFREDGAAFLISDEIREMVRFEQQNLVRPTAGFWRREAFDVVFCRNVLMYFSPEAACRVVGNIARSLAPGGYLFIGHAENLRGVSNDFHLRHSHNTFYYERRSSLGAGLTGMSASSSDVSVPAVALPADMSWFELIAQSANRIEQLSRGETGPLPRSSVPSEPLATARPPVATRAAPADLAPAMELLKQERFQDALRLLVDTLDTRSGAEPDEMLLRAMLLVSTGDISGAERLCAELLLVEELNAGAHYILAICHEHTGNPSSAIEHSRTAAYLDSEFAMPHLQLGRLARRSGDVETARRELGVALALLSREDAARIALFGGGFGREALIQLCRGELDACGGER